MFNNYQFLIVDTLLTADAKNLYTEWETRNLNIVTYKCACVTLHNGPVPGPLSILHRVQWVQCAAVDILVESLLPKIDAACRDVEAIDQKSLPDDISSTSCSENTGKNGQNALLRQMRVTRKRLGKLRSSLSSKMETMEYLLQRSSASASSSASDRSIFHHLKAAESEVKWKVARVVAAQETLHGAHQNYLAFVSVQAAKINNQANSVLKKITMLLAITSPLNLIASIFGMNVYPLTTVTITGAGENDNMLFIVLLIAMFLSSLALLATARWYKWL